MLKKTLSNSIATASPVAKILSLFLIASLVFFSQGNTAFAAEGLIGSDRILEPRLKKQREEEERQQREEQRRRLEEKRKADQEKRQRYFYGDEEEEMSEEQKAYEENKEYMSYWQRLRHSWKYAESFQDIFDQSLETTYAPAKVKSAYLNIHSGPGRNYPVIYVAQRHELVDFTAVRTEWYQIRTQDGHFGWAHMDELPESLEFEYETQSFADEAKIIATRGVPVDIGFSGGVLSDNPSAALIVKAQFAHFFSTEIETGFSRGEEIQNDFFSVNALAHPFSDLRTRPHLLLGIGQMHTTYADGNNLLRESGLYTKAGIGIIRNFDRRMQFRADLSQIGVDSAEKDINHYSQLTVGTSFLWGSSTDLILNRSIGERVKVTDLELTVFGGNVNLSHAEELSVSGVRASYHIAEDYFLEFHGMSGGDDYSQAGIAIARNLLTSEFHVSWRGRKNFWPTQFYGLVGTGMQTIDKDEQVSVSVGGGLRINPLRRFAIRIDGREHIVQEQTFEGNTSGKYLQNPELTLGLSFFF